jgi:hypothetical protein
VKGAVVLYCIYFCGHSMIKAFLSLSNICIHWLILKLFIHTAEGTYIATTPLSTINIISISQCIHELLLMIRNALIIQWRQNMYSTVQQYFSHVFNHGINAKSFKICVRGIESVYNRNEYQEYFLGVRRPVRRADNFTTFMFRLSGNLEFSTSWNPLGMSRAVMGFFYLLKSIQL